MSDLRTNRINRFRLFLLFLLFGSLSGLLIEIATHSSLLGKKETNTVVWAQFTLPVAL